MRAPLLLLLLVTVAVAATNENQTTSVGTPMYHLMKLVYRKTQEAPIQENTVFWDMTMGKVKNMRDPRESRFYSTFKWIWAVFLITTGLVMGVFLVKIVFTFIEILRQHYAQMQEQTLVAQSNIYRYGGCVDGQSH